MLIIQILLLVTIIGAAVCLMGVVRALWLASTERQDRAGAGSPTSRGGIPPITAEQTCTSCGAAVTAGSRFCSQCGNLLDRRVCPSCGREASVTDRFCAGCGARLTEKGDEDK